MPILREGTTYKFFRTLHAGKHLFLCLESMQQALHVIALFLVYSGQIKRFLCNLDFARMEIHEGQNGLNLCLGTIDRIETGEHRNCLCSFGSAAKISCSPLYQL